LSDQFKFKFKVALLIFKCIKNLGHDYLKCLVHVRDIKRRGSRLDDDIFHFLFNDEKHILFFAAKIAMFNVVVWIEV
jgi:hypothetical protein